MRRFIFGLAFVTVSYGAMFPARAEVDKIIHVCDRQERLCPEFRPRVKAPDGWTRDEAASLKYGASMFVPKGKTFGKAEAIIYAEGRYNEDRTELVQWIATSDSDWATTSGKNAKITTLPSVNPKVVINRYDNPSLKDQPVEVIAHYADLDKDGNSYVVRLAVSGRTEAAVLAAVPLLDKMIVGAKIP
ncbi:MULTISPECIES: hypothetical protein [Bradyrhizobium]|uniref:Uncharacterized protein n=1 Tax=Bradyrhizobium yuanmingense TaxID=108015 RepID=A0A1C3W3Q3_9BRAD|nr:MULTISPECIES: hypothetical protein [Bradyrhizobium]MCA1431130.1 hypothetical protein [Bradyrhizobium sp. NBAIM16]MCA1438403.1 hypothetical protein [Bradyrhizobium sp. BRP20]MCA1509244.1 hypothetical protein [Bradyrhizobium sp. NBAIM02]MCA1545227.1 hypothetical protein [Bradyrhizobium sp. BRP19]TWI27575.1 hypothetical protein IQ15_03111 [Bradyrhizobium yuanmingense]